MKMKSYLLFTRQKVKLVTLRLPQKLNFSYSDRTCQYARSTPN